MFNISTFLNFYFHIDNSKRKKKKENNLKAGKTVDKETTIYAFKFCTHTHCIKKND